MTTTEADLDRAADLLLKRARAHSSSARASCRMQLATIAFIRDEVLGWGEARVAERYSDDCRKLEQMREAMEAEQPPSRRKR